MKREDRRARATSSPTSLLSLGSSSEDWCLMPGMRVFRFTRPGGTGGSRAFAERSLGCAFDFPSGGGVRGKDFEMSMGHDEGNCAWEWGVRVMAEERGAKASVGEP